MNREMINIAQNAGKFSACPSQGLKIVSKKPTILNSPTKQYLEEKTGYLKRLLMEMGCAGSGVIIG
jgi:hypothetical protein